MKPTADRTEGQPDREDGLALSLYAEEPEERPPAPSGQGWLTRFIDWLEEEL